MADLLFIVYRERLREKKKKEPVVLEYNKIERRAMAVVRTRATATNSAP